MSKAMRLRAFLNKRNTIFHPVVRFDPAVQKLISIDLTSTNNSLTEEIYSDIERFNKFIAEHISIHNATYAIGGYDELRVVYNRSQVFDAKAAGEEPRRRHLGIDIWGESRTPVFCPYTGIVHSTGFNNNDGDYGATIILAHQFDENIFYTLYGHLSAKDLHFQAGDKIKAGEIFCSFGEPTENGNWPPHLHFQVIADIGNYFGDYPGVCSEKDRDYYLENCPDPDYILQLNRYCAKTHE